MKRSKKKPKSESVWRRELIPEDSVWRRELIPEDSVWRRELIPEDSIWRKDLLAFARKTSRCRDCPVLMIPEEHKCSRFDVIPDDIWDGIESCPLYEERGGQEPGMSTV
jgi:hypothetical protein